MSLAYKKIVKTAHPNIAFVKYWGKKGRQIPLNPSISMLIKQCYTKIECEYALGESLKIETFLFEDKENEQFKHRFLTYLENISDVYPLAKKLNLKIKSSNNFPHSSGIASSASAFAAFAKCLVEIEQDIEHKTASCERASYLARLGSGSACRSISESTFNVWGATKFELGNDESSIDLTDKVYNLDYKLLDTILVVDSGVKKISSSQGHQLMNAHPFREARIQQANENLRSLLNAIECDDFHTFGEIIENEAMSLHAMMMTSTPSYTLLHPNTLKIIELLKNEREQNELACFFTLDAGPNIHLIYPEKEKEKVKSFINSKLQTLYKDILWGSCE